MLVGKDTGQKSTMLKIQVKKVPCYVKRDQAISKKEQAV